MADITLQTIPAGPLGIIAMENIAPLAKKVDDYLVTWRREREASTVDHAIHFRGYQKDSYLLQAEVPRFASGEAKGHLLESVRGMDVYIMLDVLNNSLTYPLAGFTNHMSPDDHYMDLRRIIGAIQGKAARINVLMPYLYGGRQHKRSSRESLDCAETLQDLARCGVENIITFDAHDPRVQNAIPSHGFDNVSCIYQFIKALVNSTPDLRLDSDHLMVISPDEGAMNRAVTFANYLGIDVGMFYKRRDYSKIINGKNPIVAHEYLGRDLEGKDVVILDDMISSGESMLDVAKELRNRHAKRVFAVSTFGLFTNGLDKFDEAVEQGYICKVLTTNLTYQKPELLTRPYYVSVDLSKYIALVIDNLNHNNTLSSLLSPTDRINNFLAMHKNDPERQ